MPSLTRTLLLFCKITTAAVTGTTITYYYKCFKETNSSHAQDLIEETYFSYCSIIIQNSKHFYRNRSCLKDKLRIVRNIRYMYTLIYLKYLGSYVIQSMNQK
jgi:hypothetical protein